MNRKYLIVHIMLLLLLSYAESFAQKIKTGEYSLSGNFKALDGYTGKVYMYGRTLDQEIFRDSVQVQGGKFHFSGKLDEPMRVSIYSEKTERFPNQIAFNVYLENSRIVVSDEKGVKIVGARLQTESDSINRYLKAKSGLDTISAAYQHALSAKDSVTMANMVTMHARALTTYKKLLVDVIQDNKSNYLTLDMLADLISSREEEDVKTAKALFITLSPSVRETKRGQLLSETIAFHEKGYIIGKPAGEFLMTDKDGKDVKLSDYHGKYVLLEFWASWCKPCRAENPNLIKAYHAFKAKGFDILAVSIDTDRTRWIKAIQEDDLPWTHVSDLAKKNAAATQFGVDAIPSNFLIAPNGTVIARNLRGEKLQEKLLELL